MSYARMKAEAEAAVAALEGQDNTAPTNDTTPGTEPSTEVPAGSGTPTPDPTPTTTEPVATGDQDKLKSLEAQIATLTARLDDENNPTYKQRYSSLQGMYNSLNNETKALKAEVERLNRELSQKQEAASQAVLDDSYADLVQRYGESAAQSIVAIATQITDQRLKTEIAPVVEELNTVKSTNSSNADTIFFDSLEKLRPDWKQINGWNDGTPQNPMFAKFLATTVPATNYTYDDLLKHHYASRNFAKVAEIFDIFSPKTTAPVADPVPETNPLEKYVEPTKTGQGSTTPANLAEEIISREEIDQFYDSVIKRTFNGLPEERAALEAKYDKAIREGRVR